jgi:predicted methyltransferase
MKDTDMDIDAGITRLTPARAPLKPFRSLAWVAATLHRIEEAFLRKEVEAAGFRLIDEGHFLRNPADPRDRNTPEPPQPKDEFVLKFVKP